MNRKLTQQEIESSLHQYPPILTPEEAARLFLAPMIQNHLSDCGKQQSVIKNMAKELEQNIDSQTAEPILLDAKQAAAMLSIGRTHLYALHSSGRLPLPLRLGRRTLWRADELKKWVSAGCPSRQKWIVMREEMR